MATEPLPFIEECHYEAFRRLAPELPPTYADWRKWIGQKHAECSKNNPVQLVPILPVEFAAFCLERGLKASLSTLLLFAIDRAAEPNETSPDRGPLQQRH